MTLIQQYLSQSVKGVGSDASDLFEFVKLLKWPVLFAVGHDVRRDLRGNVESLLKVFCGCAIEVL